MNREFDTKQSEIVVDQFRPEDAPGVTECFRKVYGEDYPIKIFYQPDELIKANRTGEYYTIVARTSTGHVVAVGSLFRSAPYLRLYEAGAGLVLKEFRNMQINKRMWLFVYEEWAPKQSNVEELFGEAVYNHTIMQKTVLDFGHIETAIEVALMPAEAYTKEKSATGRVASLLVFRDYKRQPHEVFVPSAYANQLEFIYSELDDKRDFSHSVTGLPSEKKTGSDLTVFGFAQVARIFFHEIGEDFESHLTEREKEVADHGVQVIQVWLNLSCPWVGAAVDKCRKMGYFLGGPLLVGLTRMAS
jgi:hypothetical protein